VAQTAVSVAAILQVAGCTIVLALLAAESRANDGQAAPQPAATELLPGVEDLVEGPRIVNGVTTIGYPEVAALLFGTDPEVAESICTATLIGRRTLLTANHCLKESRRPTAYHAYFQNAGVIGVEWISPPHADYAFPRADIAVLRLAQSLPSPTTAALNEAPVATGSRGLIVGFGRAGGRDQESGIKRMGSILTSRCDRNEPALLCWDFSGTGQAGQDSNTCNADSGGPLFTTTQPPRVLAGVTSDGTRSDCLAGDHSFDVDVSKYIVWIGEQARGDIVSRSGARPAPLIFHAGKKLVRGELHDSHFVVPAGIKTLIVALNGADNGVTDFNLFVQRGARASFGQNDCRRDGRGNFAHCRFDSPQAGDWFARVDQQGPTSGEFQMVVTMYR
jgi:hypothetical protein